MLNCQVFNEIAQCGSFFRLLFCERGKSKCLVEGHNKNFFFLITCRGVIPALVVSQCFTAEPKTNICERKGKNSLTMLGIIHVIVLNTLQYILRQIVQMRWSVILDVVVCRPPNLIYKTVHVFLDRFYSAFSYNF